MAIAEFKNWRAWWPLPWMNQWGFDTTTFVMDASGEVCVLVVEPPKTGNIDKIATIIQAVGNAPDNGLRFSLQGVSTTTGLNDGTIKGAGSAAATVASGSVVTGFLESGAFASSYAVTRGGDPLAFVLDFPTFVAADSVTVRGISLAVGNAMTLIPYGISATSTIQNIRLPFIFAHYDDGTWVPLSDFMLPFDAVAATQSIDVNSTPDEIGAAFIPRQAWRLDQIKLWMAVVDAACAFDLVLYDSGGSVLTSKTYDGEQLSQQAGNIRYLDWILPTAQDLTAGSTYRVVIKPTGTQNVRFSYFVPPTAAITLVPGQMVDLWYTARTDAGSWTNYNNGTDGYRLPQVSFGCSGFSDSASGGTTIAGTPMLRGMV